MRNIVFIFLFFGCFVQAQTNDSIFSGLEQCLEKTEDYLAIKMTRLNELNNSLKNEQNPHTKWQVLYKLTKEYEVFIYDSAFKYALKLNQNAHTLKDKEKIAISRSQLIFILSSRGLFKEADDTLEILNPEYLPVNEKVTHYKTLVKYYMDLQQYADENFFSTIYHRRINQFCDSVIRLTDENSTSNLMYKALKQMNQNNYALAIKYYLKILENNTPNYHQQAMIHATLGYLYNNGGNKELGKMHLIKASVADIKGNIKETTALRGLAELLFESGEVERAYAYILEAKKDAEFYGTRHRIVQLSAILPKIEQAYLNKVEAKQKRLIQSTVLFTSLFIMAVLLFVITFIQLKKLRRARRIIEESNHSLHKLNQELREANLIKQRYIGFYFNKASQLIDKLELLSNTIERKLASNQYNQIRVSIKKVNSKKERQELFQTFDRTFLSIFPNYLQEYESLFSDQIPQAKNMYELSTPQRIFALIKIGIKDNDEIAKILGFSVNTIYTYKTKEKKRSRLTSEEFDQFITNIKSV